MKVATQKHLLILKNEIMKLAKRNYDLKVLSEGRTFYNKLKFECKADNSFYSAIDNEVRELFSKPEQFESINHTSRLVTISYL